MSTPNVNTAPTTVAPTQNQDRLKTFFDGHSSEAHGARWDKLWEAGDFLPWDRGFANPALIDTLKSASSWLPKPASREMRPRALIPGCGKGYDLALLSAHGYDAYGLEISENAVTAAEAFLQDPGDGNEGEYKAVDHKLGKGIATVVSGDFFEDQWLSEIGGLAQGFDLIYDCTFLSALPPSLRAPWASRMSELLAPNGVLICLEFPTHKPPKSGGPPWSLPSNVYQELFKEPGKDIEYDTHGNVVPHDRESTDKTLVRVAYWKPTRTHQVGVINGEVKDQVSVWKHK